MRPLRQEGSVLFVKGKQPAPMGYVDVPDKMMNVWRPVETADGGVVMKQTGRWVWHEDFGRGLNNYLSKDYIRSSKMGSAINKLKNATTEARYVMVWVPLGQHGCRKLGLGSKYRA